MIGRMRLKDRRIVVATNNKHKLAEIRDILSDFEVYSAKEFVGGFDPDEVGRSFCENAFIKAIELKKYVEYPVLADDSGLEVFSLGGEPGIFSSRYSDEGTDHENLKKLLKKLKDKEDRSARFVCCMVLILGSEVIEKEGYVYGRIIDNPKGENGFGYDPVFVPDGFDVTFAEMSPEEKNKLSHRRRALELIKKELESYYA